MSKWDDPVALAAELEKPTPDQTAVEFFWSELGRKWLRWIISRVGIQDAPDVLDEIFLQCYKGLRDGRLAERSKLWPFTRGVVRNWLSNYIEVAHRRAQLVSGGDEAFRVMPSPAPNPEQREAAREAAQLLNVAFGRLTDREQEIIRRFYFLHQTHEQIEAEMDLRASQFRCQKSVAVARMREFVRGRIAHVRTSDIEWAA